LRIESLAIPDVKLITPARHADERGFFSETWSVAAMREAGIAQGFVPGFVQDNHSLSRQVGTLRGLHCQVGAHPQGKLVRVLRGAIWDVAVDARRSSPTYGHHAAAMLSAENWAQLWIPPGFLHGFCTVEPDTEVFYKVTDIYDRTGERGVIWNDPELALPWPVASEAVVLSAKDQALPGWGHAAGWFAE
jgi:dTDP-4-dehydrorhamnose 3,5-epimerase